MKRSIFFLYIITFLISKQIIAQPLVINEVVYTNKEIIYDRFGDTPDYIEIYNNSNYVINLKGYQLTDDTTESTLWKFPDISLKPDSFLVVFASDRDTLIENELHTDFKLAMMHDPVYLMDENRQVVDKTDVECVPADKSLGCYPDGSSHRIVQSPSPGKSNNQADTMTIHYVPDTLTVNHKSGFYSNPVPLHFENKHPENIIYYTLDADEPDSESDTFLYDITLKDISEEKNRFADEVDNGHIPGRHIFKANVVRAIVYSDGCPASNEISNTYFIHKNVKKRFEHVPVVSLITDENNLFDPDEGIYTTGNFTNYDQRGKAWERDIHFEYFDTLGHQLINQNAGFRIHGRGSLGTAQKSLRLYARHEYGNPVFQNSFFSDKPRLSEFKTLLLRATRDWSGTVFKDELTQKIVRGMDVDYSASQTTIVYLNGEYWGIYSLRERNDEHYVENNFQLDSCLLDLISYDPHHGEVLEEGTKDSYERLLQFLERADPSAETFYDDISQMVDISAIIDFYCAQLFLANTDFPNNNVKYWKTQSDTSRWRIFFFDCDGCMIRANYDHLSEYNNTSDRYQRYDDWATFIFRTLLKNATFRQRFTDRFYELLSTNFSAQQVTDLIQYYEKLYTPLIPEHTYRWRQPRDFRKWQDNLTGIKAFALQRPLYMYQQLSNNFSNPFMIYPNPSGGAFTIQFNGTENKALVKIFRTDGVLTEKQSLAGSTRLQTSLKPGLYLVQVEYHGMIFTDKIIIQ